jgi:hypothetical protein
MAAAGKGLSCWRAAHCCLFSCNTYTHRGSTLSVFRLAPNTSEKRGRWLHILPKIFCGAGFPPRVKTRGGSCVCRNFSFAIHLSRGGSCVCRNFSFAIHLSRGGSCVCRNFSFAIHLYGRSQASRQSGNSPYSMPSIRARQLASMIFVCALTVVQELCGLPSSWKSMSTRVVDALPNVLLRMRTL